MGSFGEQRDPFDRLTTAIATTHALAGIKEGNWILKKLNWKRIGFEANLIVKECGLNNYIWS